MLVKKVGSIIFLKSKIYRTFPYLAPLVMLTSILLVAIVPNITETFQFQEPALRTKLAILQQNIPSDFRINYKQVYPGIKIAMIYGRLNHETILLASKCNDKYGKQRNQVFQSIYYSITKNNKQNGRVLAKNVAFLCFDSSQKLESFMKLLANQKYARRTDKYLDSKQNNSLLINELGIIRNALIIQLNQQSNNKESKSSSKLYFNTYTRGRELQVDIDYYQALKQLLQQVGLKWQPCRALDESKIVKKISKLFRKKRWSLFLKSNLCLFYEAMHKKSLIEGSIYENNNNAFQQNGIQTATLSLFHSPNDSNQLFDKISRLALSFVEQFVVLEDHLHSSSTIYVPLNEFKWVPLKGLIIPGLVCLLVTAFFYLIIKIVYLFDSIQQSKIEKSQQQSVETTFLENTLRFSTKLDQHGIIILAIAVLYCSSLQYYLNSTILYSLFCGALIRQIKKARSLTKNQREICRIFLAGFSVFTCQYFSIFCFPISIVTIIITNMICFLNKTTCILVIFSVLLAIMYFGQFFLFQLAIEITQLSLTAQAVLYPLLMWALII